MRLDLRRACAHFAVLLLALTTAGASAQTLRPEVYVTDGAVDAIAFSEDGSTLYIGGSFTYVGPNTGGGARLSQADGTVLPDGLFVNGTVRASVTDGSGGWSEPASVDSLGV